LNKTLNSGSIELFCCDYKDLETREKIDLIITSPPYCIGSLSPKKTGGRRLGGYDAKSYASITDYPDDMPEDKYQESQLEFLDWCSNKLSDNGVLIYNHKNRRKNGQIISPYQWLLSQKKLIIVDEITWDRGSTHNHCNRFTYQQSEFIYILSKTKKYYFKNQDFPNGRNRGVGNVWRINRASNNGHNAPFPLALAEHCIRLWSHPGDIVCDPYSGSGTVMQACRILDRRFIGSELEKKYFDLSINLYGRMFKK